MFVLTSFMFRGSTADRTDGDVIRAVIGSTRRPGPSAPPAPRPTGRRDTVTENV